MSGAYRMARAMNETTIHAGQRGADEAEPPVAPRVGSPIIHWRLASYREPDGPRYAVYVDGILITSGHRTGEDALVVAERLMDARRPEAAAH